MSAEADGRRRKGARRRKQLIEATLRVLERAGVAGVTHRAVAAEAGLPSSAATYYFRTLDDLLTATLTTAMDAYADRLEAISDSGGGVENLSAFIAELLRDHRERAVAECELYLLAARRPSLRPAALRWTSLLEMALAPHAADATTVRAAVATIDGVMLHALLLAHPPTADDINATLTTVLA